MELVVSISYLYCSFNTIQNMKLWPKFWYMVKAAQIYQQRWLFHMIACINWMINCVLIIFWSLNIRHTGSMKQFTFNYFSVILSIFYLLWTQWSLKAFLFSNFVGLVVCFAKQIFPFFFWFPRFLQFSYLTCCPFVHSLCTRVFPFWFLFITYYLSKKKEDWH